MASAALRSQQPSAADANGVGARAYSDDSYVDVISSSSAGTSPSSGEPRRPIQLNTAGTQVRIPVPVAPYEAWIAAVILRDEFHRALTSLQNEAEREALDSKDGDEAATAGIEEDDAQAVAKLQAKRKQRTAEARIVLTSKFMGFLASKLEGKAVKSSYESKVLESVWHYFNRHFLGREVDIHKLAAPLDNDVRPAVLRAYYEAYVLLDNAGVASPGIPLPHILTRADKGESQVFALFGGQGSNEVSPHMKAIQRRMIKPSASF